MNTIQIIEQFIKNHNGVSVKELTGLLGLYPTIIHRHLKKLVDQ